MPLVVRRVKVQDLSVLESLEGETVRSFPARLRWMETYRGLLERALGLGHDRSDLAGPELLARAARLGQLRANRVEVSLGERVQQRDHLRRRAQGVSTPWATARTTSSAVTTPATRPSTTIGMR